MISWNPVEIDCVDCTVRRDTEAVHYTIHFTEYIILHAGIMTSRGIATGICFLQRILVKFWKLEIAHQRREKRHSESQN